MKVEKVKESMPSTSQATHQRTSGIAAVIGTYIIWGFLPLYFALTSPATALEVVAARVVFSVLFCLLLLTFLRNGFSALWATFRQKKLMLITAIAALLVGANWTIYVVATTSGHTLDASLGYFINPLVSVLFGVIFLGEKLRSLQWIAVGLACCAVLMMSIFYGKIPWTGLGLAASFGLYGLVKSKIGGKISPLNSFTVESVVLLLPALTVMGYFASGNRLTLFSHGTGHFWLLAASGVITAVPLLLFAQAAAKIPLSIIGMVQYLGPTLQFIIAVFIFDEPLTSERFIGFILIWIACFIFAFDMFRATQPAQKFRHNNYPATGALEVVDNSAHQTRPAEDDS